MFNSWATDHAPPCTRSRTAAQVRAGLFPDVSFALMAATRMPLSVALYLALTGARITCPADLLQLRLGTHFVPSDRLETLRAGLKECTFSADSAAEELHKCVEAHAQDAPPTGAQSVAAHLHVIEDAMRPGVEAMRSGHGCVEAVRAVKAQVDSLLVRSATEARGKHRACSDSLSCGGVAMRIVPLSGSGKDPHVCTCSATASARLILEISIVSHADTAPCARRSRPTRRENIGPL